MAEPTQRLSRYSAGAHAKSTLDRINKLRSHMQAGIKRSSETWYAEAKMHLDAAEEAMAKAEAAMKR